MDSFSTKLLLGTTRASQEKAKTVDGAFRKFLQNEVNLLESDTSKAKSSRDWLLKQILNFPDADTAFPLLYTDKDIAFGSFARRTKIRPLDDIDQICCLNATGGTYKENGLEPIKITVPAESRLSAFNHDGEDCLNSIKVVNQWVKSLKSIPQYKSAQINRRSEAAVLNLSSYDWSFDIVPGFFTTSDYLGRNYYLIPDGSGHWKKTDPRKDRDRLIEVNQNHDGNVLNVIRLMKYWNRRKTMPSAPSYMFECMLTSYYEKRTNKAQKWVDIEAESALNYIAVAILLPIEDPKGIQGDLNQLAWDERTAIRNRALDDASKAKKARAFEDEGKPEQAINKWREIFGTDFPKYG